MAKKKRFSFAAVFAQNDTAVLLQKRPLLHLDCRGYAVVEHCKSILLYTNKMLLLDMGAQQLQVTGNNIVIRNFQPQAFSFSGENLQISCQNKGESV